MTDSTEPRNAEGLKPCPNVECARSCPLLSPVGLGGFIQCEACMMSGPDADTPEEATRLWNALPRPTIDTVERAAVDALWKKCGGGQHGPRVETMTIPRAQFWDFIRALPSAGGGEDKLREALRKIANNDVDGVGSLAKQYADIAKAALQQEQNK